MRREGVSLDIATFVSIWEACCKLGVVAKGEELYGETRRQGILEIDFVLGIALVNIYAKCGAIKKAQEVSDTSLQHGL